MALIADMTLIILTTINMLVTLRPFYNPNQPHTPQHHHTTITTAPFSARCERGIPKIHQRTTLQLHNPTIPPPPPPLSQSPSPSPPLPPTSLQRSPQRTRRCCGLGGRCEFFYLFIVWFGFVGRGLRILWEGFGMLRDGVTCCVRGV